MWYIKYNSLLMLPTTQTLTFVAFMYSLLVMWEPLCGVIFLLKAIFIVVKLEHYGMQAGTMPWGR